MPFGFHDLSAPQAKAALFGVRRMKAPLKGCVISRLGATRGTEVTIC